MKKTVLNSAFLVSAMCLISAFPVRAEKVALTAYAPDGQTCKMVESVTISLSFSNIPVTLEGAKSHVDDRLAEVEVLAKDAGIEKLVVQNFNYNVYTNSSGGCLQTAASGNYILSGNFSLQLDNATQAEALMKSLSGKSYQSNLNVSSYRQCQ